jgi:hypothetical protein
MLAALGMSDIPGIAEAELQPVVSAQTFGRSSGGAGGIGGTEVI